MKHRSLALTALLAAGCARPPAPPPAAMAPPPALEVRLPAPEPAPAEEQARVVLSLTADGRAFLGQDLLSLPEDPAALVEALREPLAPYAGQPIVIAADRSLSHGQVVEVLDALRTLGFTEFSVAVQAAPED